MSRPKLQLADIFRRHGEAWRTANARHLNLAQRRVMTAIEICRTAALGGHVERCQDCAHTRIAYNSCRNRHCPKPVIAVTSYALSGEEKKARAAGCDDYVPKPFSPRQLLAKIRQYLS